MHGSGRRFAAPLAEQPGGAHDFTVRIAVAFAAALLAIGAVAAASLRSLSARRDWSRWIVRTQEVRLSIARVSTLATEAESAQGRYLLEGRENYLESFRKAEEELAKEVEKLASFSRDNSRQQERIAALRALLQSRTQALRAPIDRRRGGDRAPLVHDEVSLPDAGPPPASGEVNGESHAMATGLPAC